MARVTPAYYILRELEEVKKKHEPKPEYTDWQRNVSDPLKGLSKEQVIKELEKNRLPFAFLMVNLNIDYNLGAVVRVANAFGGEVFYYGNKKYDRRGATGTYIYTPVHHISDISSVVKMKEEYEFVGLEQAGGSIEMSIFPWSKERKTLILLGQESSGLQEFPEIMELVDYFVEIKQRGSVRSLNTAVAAGIAAQSYSSHV